MLSITTEMLSCGDGFERSLRSADAMDAADSRSMGRLYTVSMIIEIESH